ncbi:winged helix-turn-helix domain-containing protein, partial [Staphylococcus pasteuri_A]
IKGNKAAQIVEQIRTQVEQQHLQAGDKLPPQRHLAEHLAVTVGTISRAYAQAEQQGLIESKTGSGSYVKSPTNYQQQWGSLKGNSQHIELWQNTAFTQSRAQHLTP